MRMLLVLAVASLGAGLVSPVFAGDACDDLWFTRNLVFDRAGYCFGSTLGQAIFDNSDCTTKAPEMDTADSNLLDRIKRNEADLGCRVDTKVRRLSVDHIEDRRKLLTFPVADGFESGCYGWKMAPVPLRLGAWDAAPQIEWITKGDDLLFDHEGDDGWDFVTLMRDGRRIGFGWFSATYDEKSCESFAG